MNLIKNFAFLLAILMLTFSSFAQKEIDFELTITHPTNGMELTYGDSLSLEYSVKNLGPETFLDTDTLFIQLKDAFVRLPIRNTIISVNDSVLRTPLQIWSGNEEDEHVSFCFYFLHDVSDSYIDLNSLNDTACVSILLKGKNSVSIKDRYLVNNLSIYPNPVLDQLIIKLPESLNTKADISIMDQLGRIVLKENITTNHKDYSIQVKTLTSGIYFLQMTNDTGAIYRAKFIKQ